MLNQPETPQSPQEAPLTPAMREALEAHGELSWRALRLVAGALAGCGLLLGALNLALAGSGGGNDVILALAGAIPCLFFAALLAAMGIATRRRCLLDIIGQRYLTVFGEMRVTRATTAAAILTRGHARSYATFDPARRVVTLVNRESAPRAIVRAAVAYTPHARYVFAVYDERGEEIYRDRALTPNTSKETTHE